MTRQTKNLQIRSTSPEHTQKLGALLGKQAIAGDLFLLVGNLGTGKTCLTQGIARGLNIKEYAFSPTFVLVREYQGRLPLYHIDLYRLDYIEDIMGLGLDDYFEGTGICVIEWADKGIKVLPQDHLLIKLQHLSDRERNITVEAHGERYVNLVKSLKAAL